MTRTIFTVVAIIGIYNGFSNCDPAYYWIWRIVLTVVAALLAVAWKPAPEKASSEMSKTTITPTKEKPPETPWEDELEALQKMSEILSPLDSNSQLRTIKYLMSRFGIYVSSSRDY